MLRHPFFEGYIDMFRFDVAKLRMVVSAVAMVSFAILNILLGAEQEIGPLRSKEEQPAAEQSAQ